MFCGTYKTAVPEGYFEHLNDLRGTKRKGPPTTEDGKSTLTGNGGPVFTGTTLNLEVRGEPVPKVALRSPENREDIRYAPSLSTPRSQDQC